mgnify:CR=1 FL=1
MAASYFCMLPSDWPKWIYSSNQVQLYVVTAYKVGVALRHVLHDEVSFVNLYILWGVFQLEICEENQAFSCNHLAKLVFQLGHFAPNFFAHFLNRPLVALTFL